MRHRIAALCGVVAVAVLAVACAQSDAGITTAVKSKFAADDTVKAYAIDVDTSERVVTLTGSVETVAAKERAVALARETDGVSSVVDNLTVDADTAATTGFGDEAGDAARDAADAAGDAADRTGDVLTDAAVTGAVKTKFLADTTVSGLAIDVDTKDGVVSLTGRVDNQASKTQALKLARETDGVKRVVDNLTIGR